MSQISYHELAKYYDEIYSWKDYETEARLVDLAIQSYCISKGRDVLDVACGTGGHISYLRKRYKVLGLDASPRMIAIARRKHPATPFKRANMTSFNLKKRFDAVLCLFSSIAHLKNQNELDQAIGSFAHHMKIGGVAIIEPFASPEHCKPGHPYTVLVNKPNLQITRSSLLSANGARGWLDSHYLIATPAKIRHINERVPLLLFKPGTMLEIFKKHGLKAIFLKEGLAPERGLYIGVKG